MVGMKSLNQIIAHYGREAAREKLFNFTGGYKGTVPLVTVWCWSNAFTLFYLHENGKEMIYIPPIEFIWNANQQGNLLKNTYASDTLGNRMDLYVIAGWLGIGDLTLRPAQRKLQDNEYDFPHK